MRCTIMVDLAPDRAAVVVEGAGLVGAVEHVALDADGRVTELVVALHDPTPVPYADAASLLDRVDPDALEQAVLCADIGTPLGEAVVAYLRGLT